VRIEFVALSVDGKGGEASRWKNYLGLDSAHGCVVAAAMHAGTRDGIVHKRHSLVPAAGKLIGWRLDYPIEARRGPPPSFKLREMQEKGQSPGKILLSQCSLHQFRHLR
jgi:hypothetical protein